jgi:HD-GYP domain-containing protein (c-di-GMP phosphodiesterase class II)
VQEVGLPGTVGSEIADIADSRERRARPTNPREWPFFLAMGGGFLVFAVAVAMLTSSTRHPSPLMVALLVAAYAATLELEFEVGTTSVHPNMLVLVPMLFVLPTGWAPLAIGAAAVIVALFRANRARGLLARLAFSWTEGAPVLVLLAAGEQAPSWGRWPLYLGALFAYEAADWACVALYNRVIRSQPPIPIRTFLTDGAQFDLLLAPIGFVTAIASATFAGAALVPLALLPILHLLTRERSERVSRVLELSQAYRGTALLLGAVIDADDGYTGLHSRGVVDLAVAVANAMRFDPEMRNRCEFAALLHDVGKIRIPNEIINKPGPLTPDEWAIVRRHPGDGAEMLQRVGGFLAEIAVLVRHHHERFDGSGYPDGLAGEAIPLIARVIAACDAYSAMTTDRAYRPAMPPADAISELQRGSGSQFDPQVVQALCQVVAGDATPAAVNATTAA